MFLEDSYTDKAIIPLTEKTLKEQINLLQQENFKLKAEGQEKDNIINNTEIKFSVLNEEIEKKNESIQAQQQEIENLQNLAKRGKKALIKILRSLEEKKRQELKARLFNDSFRLGRVTMVRTGTKFQEY